MILLLSLSIFFFLPLDTALKLLSLLSRTPPLNKQGLDVIEGHILGFF